MGITKETGLRFLIAGVNYSHFFVVFSKPSFFVVVYTTLLKRKEKKKNRNVLQ